MAQLQQQERLQPALLDRLTDDYPQKRKRKQEAAARSPDADKQHPADAGEDQLLTDAVANSSDDSGSSLGAGASLPLAAAAPAVEQQSDRLVISARKLREIVKRDLSWLMNTGNLESVQDLDDFPLARESVINYGVPDLTGAGVSNVNIKELERRLHRILLRYEPRILRKTLKISVSKSTEMSRNALRFDIECDIWGQPAPEHIHLNSELDLELGSFKFTDTALG